MTDRITKALNKLSPKEQKSLAELLQKIKKGQLESLDVKKLKGRTDLYRVRKGDLRVIFRRTDAGDIFILAVERRTDTTYNAF
jgi:mRNA-degrading endonuclease RelE of RelBE toxin-antitoxin system